MSSTANTKKISNLNKKPTSKPAAIATTTCPNSTLLQAPPLSPSVTTTPHSNIVRHVPTRALSVDQILDFAENNSINNEMLLKVGLRMNRNLLVGSNQRCVAMLIAFKSIMDDINMPTAPSPPLPPTITAIPAIVSGKPVKKSSSVMSERPLNELQHHLKQAMEFLDFCRPLSVSMTNAYKLIKDETIKLDQTFNEQAIAMLSLNPASNADDTTAAKQLCNHQEAYEEQKEQLKKFIDRFIDEEIWSAQRGICENIKENITTNDVILVYGCSTIIQHVLLHAKTIGKKTFRVIVVDSAPHLNGRRMLSFLNDNLIDCSYTLINSLSFVIRQATKVLLGANSMLANGYVMSHIGTSQIALMAKATNVPTLVCCETYKLNDRVYVDSFGCNEVDGGHELGSALNLRYDLTPPEFVSMVITEKSTIPAKSVPAILRFRAEKKTKVPLATGT